MTPLVIPSDQRIVDIAIDQPPMDGRGAKLNIILKSGTILGGRVHGELDKAAFELLSSVRYQEPTAELFQWLQANVHAEPARDPYA